MNNPAKLEELIAVERIDTNQFRSKQQQANFNGAIFGGQVISQALLACSETIADVDRSAHSLHSYFLRSGDPKKPVIYKIDAVRDGRSFSFRQVYALQNDQIIFSMGASFHISEDGFEHQDKLPESALKLLDDYELARSKGTLSDGRFAYGNFEVQPTFQQLIKQHEKTKPSSSGYWFRATDKIPEKISYQKAALAYISDLGPTATIAAPHDYKFASELQVASLDHAVWFHSNSLNLNDWHYYSISSNRSKGARGLARTSIFTKEGELVASSSQEGLVRIRRK